MLDNTMKILSNLVLAKQMEKLITKRGLETHSHLTIKSYE